MNKYTPSKAELSAATGGLDTTDDEEPRPNPARDNEGNAEVRPIELELRRRNESRCCLFSLSRSFFSVLFMPRSRNRVAANILTGDIDGVGGAVGREKLSDDSACDGLRENKLVVDI